MRLLLHYPLHPQSRKVRLALAEKKLDCEFHIEKPWDEREELFNLNPAGEVPVLKDGNVIVTGDPGIIEYLEEIYPEINLIGREVAERIEIRRISAWFDQKFYNEAAYPLLNEKLYRRLAMEGGPDSQLIRKGQAAIGTHLDYIAWLMESRNWLAGDWLSLADLSAAAALSCLDYLGDLPWEKYPGAKQWYMRIKSRPTFRPLLADRIPGVLPALHYADLDF